MHLICIGTVHEHCTFGSSDEKVRSRCHFAVTTDLNFDLLLGVATFGGCTVGITAKDNKPARKPWRFVTNNKRLVDSLGMLKCTHDKHAPLEGKYARNSAFYPEPLCQIMLHALFPHVVNAHVFCMPCTPRVNHSHRQHVVKGMPCVPIDVLMHESGCKEFVTPAFVHRLLERAE